MNTAVQMQSIISAPKRKRLEEPSSIAIVESYKCPFGGITKVHTEPLYVTEQAVDVKPSPFEDVPYEQFLHIISYLGPSTSLTSMSCVSHRYNRFMRRIGDTMITKARDCFRCPLKSKDGIDQEASISIFVRYSSYCSYVNKRLDILDHLLSSSNITSDQECKERPTKRFRVVTYKNSLHGMHLSRSFITKPDVDKSLDIANQLMSELSNSISSPDQHMCCSRRLEARLIATVGKIGGVVFQNSKAALEAIQQEGAGAHFRIIEGSSPSDISNKLERQISEDVERFDMARVLLKKVVFYKLLFECN